MRVLHLHSGNLYGGVETFLVTLARLRALGPEMEPEFALCFEGRVAEELRAAGVKVHVLGGVRVSRPWTVWQARRRLSVLLRAERFDVAVAHSTWSQGVLGPVAQGARVPLALFLHGPVEGRNWVDRWGALTVPALVLCNSVYTRGFVTRLYAEGKVRVELSRLPLPAPEVVPDARSAVRAELGVDGKTVVIAQVSRMEPFKGHGLHLDALARMDASRPWQCWMVGGAQREAEQAYLAGLKAQCERLGLSARVRFLGERKDVRRLLAAADVYCQPNAQPEPFGLSLVEALDARLPVVTSALGGAVEVVDPSCGFCVEPDAVKVAAALRRLVEEPALRERLGSAGPARARGLCDPTARLGELSTLLRSASEQSRRS